jgi:hypothetical protein
MPQTAAKRRGGPEDRPEVKAKARLPPTGGQVSLAFVSWLAANLRRAAAVQADLREDGQHVLHAHGGIRRASVPLARGGMVSHDSATKGPCGAGARCV